VEESGKYVGFCSLGLLCQPTENIQLRNHFKMQSEMTGVLVSKINPLSDAYNILKKDDIILTFDGVPIANDGTGTLFLFFTHVNLTLDFYAMLATYYYLSKYDSSDLTWSFSLLGKCYKVIYSIL
jgi:hypothetical protein